MGLRFKKVSAFLTALCFILNSSISPSAAQAANVVLPVSEIQFPKTFDLNISADLGTVESIHAGSGPVLFHIQEAHGSYEVQKKIQLLLEQLKDQYSFDLVLLEGSSFKLHPELIRFYPGQEKRNLQINEELMRKGVFSGPELYLTSEHAVGAYGIENLDAYVENGAAFKAVHEAADTARSFAQDLDMQIERLTAPYLNKNLRHFISRSRDFDLKNIPFEIWIDDLRQKASELLELDLTHPVNQIHWPMLLRMFKLIEIGDELDMKAFLKEKDRFLEAIRRFIPETNGGKSLYSRIEKHLSQPLSHNQLPDPETTLLFESMIERLPANFNYAAFPQVNLFIGHLILQSELKGDRLMNEVGAITRKIEDALIENEQEKEIIAVLHDYRLVQKLFSLELTPEDYEMIEGQAADANRVRRISPKKLAERLKRINQDQRVKDIEFGHLDELERLFEKALVFYRGAKKRDLEMIRNIEKRLQETGKQKAVVITGGFHAQPFKDYFTAKDYSYALLTPQITQETDKNAYIHSILDHYFQPSKSKTSTYMNIQRGMTPAGEKLRQGRSFAADDALVAAQIALEEDAQGSISPDLLTRIRHMAFFNVSPRGQPGLERAPGPRKEPGYIFSLNNTPLKWVSDEGAVIELAPAGVQKLPRTELRSSDPGKEPSKQPAIPGDVNRAYKALREIALRSGVTEAGFRFLLDAAAVKRFDWEQLNEQQKILVNRILKKHGHTELPEAAGEKTDRAGFLTGMRANAVLIYGARKEIPKILDATVSSYARDREKRQVKPAAPSAPAAQSLNATPQKKEQVKPAAPVKKPLKAKPKKDVRVEKVNPGDADFEFEFDVDSDLLKDPQAGQTARAADDFSDMPQIETPVTSADRNPKQLDALKTLLAQQKKGHKISLHDAMQLAQAKTGNKFHETTVIRALTGAGYKPGVFPWTKNTYTKKRIEGNARSELRTPAFKPGYGIEPPYDFEFSMQIEEAEPDKEIRAGRQVEEVFRNFKGDIERRNIHRIRREFNESGRFLAVSRFGRASYFLMLLASASRYLNDVESLQMTISQMENLLDKAGQTVLRNQITRLRGAVEDFAVLADEKNISRADIEGRRLKLLKAIEGFEADAKKQVNRIQARLRQKIVEEKTAGTGLSETAQKLSGVRGQVSELTEQLHELLQEIDVLLQEDEGREAIFSVFLQRASATGVRNIVRINAGEDPFEADEEHIAEAIDEAGDGVYASPDNHWLEAADYWVEALPLYIHEAETELPGGGPKTRVVIKRDEFEQWVDSISESDPDVRSVMPQIQALIDSEVIREMEVTLEEGAKENRVVIEQEAFEAVLRQLAPHWVHNINAVIDSENMALARELWARFQGGGLREIAAVSDPETYERNLEAAIIEQISPGAAAQTEESTNTIYAIAAAIDSLSRQHAEEVSSLMENNQLSRFEAIRIFFAKAGNKGEVDVLAAKLLQPAAAGHDAQVETALDKIKAYRQEDLLLQKRREVPTWIILTTQAAGMSNMFASFWLEEEMGLYALTSDVKFNETSLEKEARDLSRAQSQKITAIAREVIKQFNREWQIEQFTTTLGSEDRAIMTILAMVPDIRREVSKIAVLWERELGQLPSDFSATLDSQSVRDLIEAERDSLLDEATELVIKQNEELDVLARKSQQQAREKVDNDQAYRQERDKIIQILARDRVIARDEDRDFLLWLSNQYLRLHTPGATNLGLSTARKKVISSYFRYDDGTLEKIEDWVTFWKERESQGASARPGQPLWNLLNHPLYAYEATGGNKKFNKGYGPSRVDLGAKERHSVQVLPQWVGPADAFAKKAMVKFYRLYNYDVRPFDDVRIAETLKPGENHSMEQAVFHAQRMQSFVRAIGTGNYSALAHQWNDRSEIFMRNGGGCQGGFCQPKDIYFLPLVVGISQDDALRYAGIPVNKHAGIKRLIRHLLIERNSQRFMNDAEWRQWAMQELRNNELITKAFGITASEPDEQGNTAFFFDSARFIPPLARIATALNQIGIRDPNVNPHGFLNALAADFHGRGKGDDEGGMRFMVVELVHSIQEALDYARKRSNGQTPAYEDSTIALPVEYKPVPDVRLSIGLRLFELMAGTGEHLLEPLTDEAKAISHLILEGYDSQDAKLELMLRRAFNVPVIDEELRQDLREAFPQGKRPKDLRVFSPYQMTPTSIFDYVTGNRLKEFADKARVILRSYGLSDEQIDATVITHGTVLEDYPVFKRQPSKLAEAKTRLERILYPLILQVRLDHFEWKQGPGSDIWTSLRGTDVNSLLVHYHEVTGAEDAGTETLDPAIVTEISGEKQSEKSENEARVMIENLGRVRDTMMDGNPDSSLVIFDAPTQGRKPAFDILGIKQWQALNTTGKNALEQSAAELDAGRAPVYASTGLGQEEVERYEQQMRADRRHAHELLQALKSGQIDRALKTYDEIRKSAPDRFYQARQEEELAKSAAVWWRGGGFMNISMRHRYVSEGFSKVERGLVLSQLDWGTFLILGGMFLLNGEPAEEIEEARRIFEEALSRHRDAIAGHEPKRTAVSQISPFDRQNVDTIEDLFVTAKYEAPIEELKQIGGERTSLKRREVDEESAAGQALKNYEMMMKARAEKQRAQGFETASSDSGAQNNFDLAYNRAKEVIGDGQHTISYENYGQFLGYAKYALLAAVHEIIPDQQNEEAKAITARIQTLFGKGRELDADAWQAVAGAKEDIGDFGRLGQHLEGDREGLKRLTKAMELFIMVMGLEMTLRYQLMEDAAVDQIGRGKVATELMNTIARFYATTLYDHFFDYLPKIITPSESGPYMTDYNFILGTNFDPTSETMLGEGKPFSRDEMLEISADIFAWMDTYFDGLIRSRGTLRGFSDTAKDKLLGSSQVQPIGTASENDTPAAKRWWRMTQKRELAYQAHDGHEVVAVFDQCADCAAILNADRVENGKLILGSRANVAIISPAGRTHITTFFEEAPDYNEEHPERQANWFITREANFIDDVEVNEAGNKERLLTISSGFIYVSRSEYIAMRVSQLGGSLRAERQAIQEADAALLRNPKGILVAVEFAQPIISSFSFPFHGAPYYLAGEDEAVGLPTTQSWLQNLLFYRKTEHGKIHHETSGVPVPHEIQWLKQWQYTPDGKRRPEADIRKEILDGRDGFAGLRDFLQKHWKLIAKAESQSGGRGAFADQVLNAKGEEIPEKLDALVEHLIQVGWTDNSVIQELIPSDPRTWASLEYVDAVMDGLVDKGISFPWWAKMFVYSRIIAVSSGKPDDLNENEYDYPLELVVTSLQAISNVGLGGVLKKSRMPFYRNQELAELLQAKRRQTAFNSMRAIEERADVLNSEIAAQAGRNLNGVDRTGTPYTYPRYIMHDMLDIPVIEVNGQRVERPQIVDFTTDREGNLDKIILLTEKGEQAAGEVRWERIQVDPEMIRDWEAVLIENNIGYGLWAPFKYDERQEEKERARKTGEQPNPKNWGHDLRTIMSNVVNGGYQYVGAVTHHEQRPVYTAPPEQAPVEADLPGEPVTAEGMAFASADDLSLEIQKLAYDYLLQQRSQSAEDLRDAVAETPDLLNELKDQAADFLKVNREHFVQALENSIPVEAHRRAAVTDPYLDRNAELVVERIFSVTRAPYTVVTLTKTKPEAVLQTQEGRLNHLVVFDDVMGLRGELFGLVRDAYLKRDKKERSYFNVLAAKPEWLARNGQIKRVLYYDHSRGIFVETELTRTLTADRVQYKGVAARDQLTRVYRDQNVSQINPFVSEQSAASAARDKNIVMNLFEDEDGINHPAGVTLAQHSAADAVVFGIKAFVNAQPGENITFFIQPRLGTEGENVSRWQLSRQEIEQLTTESPVVTAIQAIQAYDDVVLRREVGNLRFGDEGRRMTLRINVASLDGGRARAESGYVQIGAQGADTSAISQGGQIVSFETAKKQIFQEDEHGTRQPFLLTDDVLKTAKVQAERVLQKLNQEFPGSYLRFAGIDIELETAPDGQVTAWVLDVNPEPEGLVHAREIASDSADPHISDILFTPTSKELAGYMLMNYSLDWKKYNWSVQDGGRVETYYKEVARELEAYLQRFDRLVNEQSGRSAWDIAVEELPQWIGNLIIHNSSLHHGLLIDSISSRLPEDNQKISILWDAIASYLETLVSNDSLFSEQPKGIIPILKERAHFILSQIYRGNGEDEKAEAHKKAIDKIESDDMSAGLDVLIRDLRDVIPRTLRYAYPENEGGETRGPLKVAFSSEAGQDKHGAAKLEGANVLHAGINVVPVGETEPAPPVLVTSRLLDEPKLVFKGFSDLPGDFETYEKVYTVEDFQQPDILRDFFSVAEGADLKIGLFSNRAHDRFIFFKYALIFSRIIGYSNPRNNQQDYMSNPQRIWEDLMAFTGGKGLELDVINKGPSSVGLSSSSAVMSALLAEVLRMSGQDKLLNHIENLAVMAENGIPGFRSGWNDTFALLPGVHHSISPATPGLPTDPENLRIDYLQISPEALGKKYVLIHTGVQRQAGKTIASRHDIFLSKDPRYYPLLLAIREVHQAMADILNQKDPSEEDWQKFGELSTVYMMLRAGADPAAVTDDLLYFFNQLQSQGLIYGGMLAGAMGGGIAQVVVTDKANEMVDNPEGGEKITRLEKALLEIKKQKPVFNNPLLGVIPYGLNANGIEYRTVNVIGDQTDPLWQPLANRSKPELRTVKVQQLADIDGYEVYRLSSGASQADITALGANPVSLVIAAHQRLWHAGYSDKRLVNEETGAPLAGGMPFMFPWTSRIDRGTFEYDDRRFDINDADFIRKAGGGHPLHGMTDKIKWTKNKEEVNGNKASVQFKLNTKEYPALRDDFGLGDMTVLLTYTLEGDTFKADVQVINQNADGLKRRFTFGHHPFYRLGKTVEGWQVVARANQWAETNDVQVPLYQRLRGIGEIAEGEDLNSLVDIKRYIERVYGGLEFDTKGFARTAFYHPETGQLLVTAQSLQYPNNVIWIPGAKEDPAHLAGVASSQPTTSVPNALNQHEYLKVFNNQGIANAEAPVFELEKKGQSVRASMSVSGSLQPGLKIRKHEGLVDIFGNRLRKKSELRGFDYVRSLADYDADAEGRNVLASVGLRIQGQDFSVRLSRINGQDIRPRDIPAKNFSNALVEYAIRSKGTLKGTVRVQLQQTGEQYTSANWEIVWNEEGINTAEKDMLLPWIRVAFKTGRAIDPGQNRFFREAPLSQSNTDLRRIELFEDYLTAYEFSAMTIFHAANNQISITGGENFDARRDAILWRYVAAQTGLQMFRQHQNGFVLKDSSGIIYEYLKLPETERPAYLDRLRSELRIAPAAVPVSEAVIISTEYFRRYAVAEYLRRERGEQAFEAIVKQLIAHLLDESGKIPAAEQAVLSETVRRFVASQPTLSAAVAKIEQIKKGGAVRNVRTELPAIEEAAAEVAIAALTPKIQYETFIVAGEAEVEAYLNRVREFAARENKLGLRALPANYKITAVVSLDYAARSNGSRLTQKGDPAALLSRHRETLERVQRNLARVLIRKPGNISALIVVVAESLDQLTQAMLELHDDEALLATSAGQALAAEMTHLVAFLRAA